MEKSSAVNETIETIKDFLKLGPSNLVGINIGLSSIKISELQHLAGDEYKLVRFTSVKLPDNALIEDEVQDEEGIIKALVQGIQDSKISNKNAAVSLFGPNTMCRRLAVSAKSDKEIEDQVMWESEQYIPFGVDESSISFHQFGRNAGGGVDIFLVAARNDVIETFQDIVKEAGMKLKVVDLEMCALFNIFEYTHSKKIRAATSCIMFLDFGAQKTNVLIIKDGNLIFTRELNIGGILFTEEIQRQMDLSLEEAENLKRGNQEEGIPEDVVSILGSINNTFFTEIEKTVNFFKTTYSNETFEICYLTGGTSLTHGLKDGLGELLGIPVEYYNPFERLTFDKKRFDEDTLSYISIYGAVSLGLAMRKVP